MPSIGSFICNFSSPKIARWPEVKAPHAESVTVHADAALLGMLSGCAVPGTLKEGDLE